MRPYVKVNLAVVLIILHAGLVLSNLGRIGQLLKWDFGLAM